MKKLILLTIISCTVICHGQNQREAQVNLLRSGLPGRANEFSTCFPYGISSNWLNEESYVLRYYEDGVIQKNKLLPSYELLITRTSENNKFDVSICDEKYSWEYIKKLPSPERSSYITKKKPIDLITVNVLYATWARALYRSRFGGLSDWTWTGGSLSYISIIDATSGPMAAMAQFPAENKTAKAISSIAGLLKEYLQSSPKQEAKILAHIKKQCEEYLEKFPEE